MDFWLSSSCWAALSLVGVPLLLLDGPATAVGRGPIPLVCTGDGGLAALAAGGLPASRRRRSRKTR